MLALFPSKFWKDNLRLEVRAIFLFLVNKLRSIYKKTTHVQKAGTPPRY